MTHACKNSQVDHLGGGGGVDRARQHVERCFKLWPTVWFFILGKRFL